MVATKGRGRYVTLSGKFQCPEGLLLGRNNECGDNRRHVYQVSVPRRAVAWSQPMSVSASAMVAGFSAPKGCCLVATSVIHTLEESSVVSVPRRAVAWSQHGAESVLFSKGCCFSAPKGCCLVATHGRSGSKPVPMTFQCPEGLLLGRNALTPHTADGCRVVSVPRRAVAWSQPRTSALGPALN